MRKSMYLQTCGSFKSAKEFWVAMTQIGKSQNHKFGQLIRKFEEGQKSNFLSPQTCRFSICGTYLRAAHLSK